MAEMAGRRGLIGQLVQLILADSSIPVPQTGPLVGDQTLRELPGLPGSFARRRAETPKVKGVHCGEKVLMVDGDGACWAGSSPGSGQKHQHSRPSPTSSHGRTHFGALNEATA
jgi:hypothetical protein